MKLSVVIPLHNEEGNVVELIDQIYYELKNIDHELILIDDGSSDNTVNEILKKKKHYSKLIVLARKYGQSTALKAGLDYCSGEWICILDGDLQNNPKEIVLLISEIEKNKIDMIQGFRKKRHDSASKKIASKGANYFIQLLFKTKLNDVGCSLKFFRREILSSFIYFDGFHRLMPLIAHIKGYTVAEMEVSHMPRKKGKSKYGVSRFFSVLIHLLKLKLKPESLNQKIPYLVKKKTVTATVILE